MECLIGDLAIHYEIRGAGRPLVMLHGFELDHRMPMGCMEPLFESLPGWQRIYLDLPGMGQTPGPEWIQSSDEMLDVVQRFVRQLLGERPYALMGQSYGGYLAQGLTLLDADLIEGLMLLAPLVAGDLSRRNLPKREVLARDSDLLERLSPQERADYEPMIVVQSEDTWRRMKRDVLPGLAAADQSFLGRLRAHYLLSMESRFAEGPFDKPVLILTARQDSVVGYEDAWPLLGKYSRATFAVLDRAGHNVQVEQPELFAALVKEWLARVEREWI